MPTSDRESNHSTAGPGAKQIALASLGALAVATLLLFTVVLPAEFNLDPLGTGQLLGIAGMSEEQRVGALSEQNAAQHTDRYTIVLAPFESVEYKYRLSEGGGMLFTWEASADIYYDMHSEQDGVDPEEYAPSFAQGEGQSQRGTYIAPFNGIHGWFWENRSAREVELELTTTGFYNEATEFRDRFEDQRSFEAD